MFFRYTLEKIGKFEVKVTIFVEILPYHLSKNDSFL